MSETPRTDAELDGWVPEFRGPSENSFIAFARQLERELSESQAALAVEREGRQRLSMAATDYKNAVITLFVLRDDGPCLAERRPTKDSNCLAAFRDLDSMGKALTFVLEGK